MSGRRQGSGSDERSPAGAGRRLWGDESRLHRALRWVLGDREHIDQEGLLAERTLVVRRPRRPSQDDGEAGPGPERRRPEPRD